MSGAFIFHNLINEKFCVIAPRPDEPCCLCADDSGVCSRCISAIFCINRKRLREIHADLVDMGDYSRAAKLAKYFAFRHERPVCRLRFGPIEKPRYETIDIYGPRQKLGLTQDEMAKELGIKRSLLAAAETGRKALPGAVKPKLLRLIQDTGQSVTNSA